MFANLLEFGLGGLCRADCGPGDVLEVLGAVFLIRNALLEFLDLLVFLLNALLLVFDAPLEFVDPFVFLLERGRLLIHPLPEFATLLAFDLKRR
ncbi:hypothetical protein BRC93_05035 [Halobacteriales archaeon QS_5_70_15]|nr:MAG: hypothetical protein BRC93_05035 [Halobacteriales archaeon QS_5_70_15]